MWNDSYNSNSVKEQSVKVPPLPPRQAAFENQANQQVTNFQNEQNLLDEQKVQHL